MIDNRQVFVADHAWRQRAVRAGTAAAGALLLGWLVAIVIGGLGFGSLPGLPFAGGGEKERVGAPVQLERPKPSSTGASSAGAPALRRSQQVSGDHGASAAQSPGSPAQSAPGTGGSGGGAPSTNGTSGPPGQGGSVPGSTTSTGNGRGPPAIKPVGGRGAPAVNPSGKVPGANAHGSNLNAGRTNAGGDGVGKLK